MGTVTNADIIRFTPTALGDITAGSFSWYFDGSDVGLTQAAENIDAISFAPDGRLLFSTSGNLGVTGVSAVDEDITAFTPTQLGATTSGSFAWLFRWLRCWLSHSSTEDTDGLWVDPLTGKLYLSTEGAYAVTGVSGDGADIFICTPGLSALPPPAPSDRVSSSMEPPSALRTSTVCLSASHNWESTIL